MTNEEKMDILDTISEAINAVDKENEFGLGDKLFDAIIKLRLEWGFDTEEDQ